MKLKRRGRQWWLDVRIGGQRIREALKTANKAEAHELANARMIEISKRPVDPAKRRQKFSGMTIPEAIDAYCEERRAPLDCNSAAPLYRQVRHRIRVRQSRDPRPTIGAGGFSHKSGPTQSV